MYDGSITIDTRIDRGGFNKDAKTLKKDLGNVANTFKKVGAAIGIAFGIKAIADFVKSSNQAYKEATQNEVKLATAMRARMRCK